MAQALSWGPVQATHMESASLFAPPPSTCQECRVKKVKCDKGRPCGRCLSRGIECRDRHPPAVRAPHLHQPHQQHQHRRPPVDVMSSKRGPPLVGHHGRLPPPPHPMYPQDRMHTHHLHDADDMGDMGPDMGERLLQQWPLGNDGRPVLAAYHGLSVLPPESVNQHILASAQRAVHRLNGQGFISQHALLRTLQRWALCGDVWGADMSLGMLRYVRDLLRMSEAEVFGLPVPHPLLHLQAKAHDPRPAEEERLSPYLAAVDDWTSAVVVHTEDMGQGQERVVTNQHFSRIFATSGEVVNTMRNERMLFWLVLMRFVAPEDRASAVEVYLRFLLTDPASLSERSIVVKMLERNGHTFYGKMRFRREATLDKLRLSEVVSISPLCEPTMPGPLTTSSSGLSSLVEPAVVLGPTHGLPPPHSLAQGPSAAFNTQPGSLPSPRYQQRGDGFMETGQDRPVEPYWRQQQQQAELTGPPAPRTPPSSVPAWSPLLPHGGCWSFTEVHLLLPGGSSNPTTDNQQQQRQDVALLVGAGDCVVESARTGAVGLQVASQEGMSGFCSHHLPAFMTVVCPRMSPSTSPSSLPRGTASPLSLSAADLLALSASSDARVATVTPKAELHGSSPRGSSPSSPNGLSPIRDHPSPTYFPRSNGHARSRSSSPTPITTQPFKKRKMLVPPAVTRIDEEEGSGGHGLLGPEPVMLQALKSHSNTSTESFASSSAGEEEEAGRRRRSEQAMDDEEEDEGMEQPVTDEDEDDQDRRSRPFMGQGPFPGGVDLRQRLTGSNGLVVEEASGWGRRSSTSSCESIDSGGGMDLLLSAVAQVTASRRQ